MKSVFRTPTHHVLKSHNPCFLVACCLVSPSISVYLQPSHYIKVGYLYENAVAQILTANGHDLFYYTFKNLEQKRNYEIDFIISKKNKICPIEVKSSNYKKHTSIDEFYKKYSSRILERYIIHTKDVSKDQDILCLPIYLTQFIL